MTTPPQGLNLNEYGIESEVTALQVRNIVFLGRKRAKIFFLFIRLLFTRRLARLSLGVFLEGGQMVCCPPSRLGGHGRIAPPPDPPVATCHHQHGFETFDGARKKHLSETPDSACDNEDFMHDKNVFRPLQNISSISNRLTPKTCQNSEIAPGHP